jgi:3-hydroxy-9,10-secoandrosta-1,3,5(10)-triene-9,17-dione monooxygenase
VRVNEAFVPQDFTLDPARPSGQPSPGSAINPAYIYRLPIGPVFPFNVATPALGVARGALEAYVELSAPARATQPGRQLRVAESAAEIDAAEALLRADAAEVARLGRLTDPIPTEVHVKWKRDLAFAAQLCLRAVDRLATGVGAHGILENTPIHRASRDMHGIANHAGNTWEYAALSFGRVAFGLDPGDPRSGA